MYYVFIENDKINGIGQCECLNENIQNIVVTEEVYNAIASDKLLYIWDGTDVVLNPNYEQEQAEKEKQERIKEIHAELDALDLKSVRPLRAGETDRLAVLEAQAVELREELQELINANSTD